jgi:hypothetical protein
MQEAVKQNQIAGVVTAVARRGVVAYLESFGSVHTDPSQSGHIGSAGEYSGSGFFYTSFFVDPKEELIGIFMSQMQPAGDGTLSRKFRVLPTKGEGKKMGCLPLLSKNVVP